jgi:SAM-dependent methyltransferase
MTKPNPNVDAFVTDATVNGGYLYTTNARLSSHLANARMTDATLALTELTGRRALDVGCGDGSYTNDLYDRGRPALLHGIDPASAAVECARQRKGHRPIQFTTGSAYELPYSDGAFDVAILRGVLHHMDQPRRAIAEALRVAATMVVLEPNGYNPVVKLLEKVSAYHREHDEKSYSPHVLNSWVVEAGGEITATRWIGLVPFFCPDLMARVLKGVEPILERTPLLRSLCCGQYVLTACRRSQQAATRQAA